MAQIIIVRCKCPGHLGTARLEGFSEFLDQAPSWSPWNRCWTCRAPFKVTVVEGRKTDHECGALCMASKGPAYNCSCGGKNHGKSYT